MHAMCWTSFIFICELNIFQTLQKIKNKKISADLQSCHGFQYILFNSTTSWQIRHRFKFRSKSHVCDDRKVILKMSHTWKLSRYFLASVSDSVGCAEECKSFRVWGHCLNGSCWVSSVYVGGAMSGKTCRLGSHDGGAATSNMDARMFLVMNVAPRLVVVILIAVIFLLFIGYQGTAAELSQWLAQNPKADLINKWRERVRW